MLEWRKTFTLSPDEMAGDPSMKGKHGGKPLMLILPLLAPNTWLSAKPMQVTSRAAQKYQPCVHAARIDVNTDDPLGPLRGILHFAQVL